MGRYGVDNFNSSSLKKGKSQKKCPELCKAKGFKSTSKKWIFMDS